MAHSLRKELVVMGFLTGSSKIAEDTERQHIFCLSSMDVLERVCSQTQLCQLRCFNDYIRQLHVSAPTGHLQVVFKRT